MDEAGKKRLLEEYAANKRPETREQLILDYQPKDRAERGGESWIMAYKGDTEAMVS